MSDYKLLINGELVDGDDTMDVINPATEEVLATCARASIAQADAAIAAAKEAYKTWGKTPAAERRACIHKLADLFHARADEFIRLLTEEQGKPTPEAAMEVEVTEVFLRELSNFSLETKVLEENEAHRVEIHRKPLGVVAAIIPWNFPLMIIAFKLPAALYAGNTVIVKPAPTTPLTALLLGELCAEAFPPGVVNILTDQNDLGGHLTLHPDIAKVSFTGSSETGKKVMQSAASSLKRITLELGGNDAAIVLPDANVPEVTEKIFGAAFFNCGQVCLALKRVYAHESIYEEVVDSLSAMASAAIVDDGSKQGTQIGPLNNKMQYEKVQGFLEDAKRDGVITAGGEVPDRPGYFIQPTIVRDVDNGDRIVDEEQFGPILPIIKYSDIDDAVERANATPWGLGGSVWSADKERATEIACAVDSGTVWVNQHLDVGPHIPFGGAKQSGMGVEFGQEGLEEFTQMQVINIAQ